MENKYYFNFFSLRMSSHLRILIFSDIMSNNGSLNEDHPVSKMVSDFAFVMTNDSSFL